MEEYKNGIFINNESYAKQPHRYCSGNSKHLYNKPTNENLLEELHAFQNPICIWPPVICLIPSNRQCYLCNLFPILPEFLGSL